MTKISSNIFYLKKFSPIFSNLFLIFFLVIAIAEKGFKEGFFMVAVGLGLLIYINIIYFKYVWGMVDAVYDKGSYLVIKNGGIVDNINYSEIVDVEYFSRQAPRRVTLHLATTSKFGNVISFSPYSKFTWITQTERNEVVDGLIDKVNRDKVKRG